jgi:2-haloacid dehalogenase
VADRWATFDCYGTLIDWNAGIRAQLERLFGGGSGDRLLMRYHEVEPEVQAESFRTYRDVLAATLGRLAAEERAALPEHEADALGRSLADWPPFPEVPAALEEARRRGWKLAILSNSDRDLIADSIERLGVVFEHAIVAEEVRSYKPRHGHWRRFEELARPAPGRHVHVAASLFHDIGPAQELGLPSVWVNRLGEDGSSFEMSRVIADLSPLPDALDELVPA